jgi:hypothetical protein
MALPNRRPHGKPWQTPRPYARPVPPAGRPYHIRRWPVEITPRGKEDDE